MTNQLNAKSMQIGVCLLFTALFCTNATAAVTLDLGEATANQLGAGGTISVGVFASSDASDVMSGFTLPLDVNNDGNSLPAGFSLNATPIQNSIYKTNLNQGMNGVVDVDGIVNGSGDDETLTTSQTRLFDLVIDFDGTVTSGTTIPIGIINPTPVINQFKFSGPASPSVSTILDGEMRIIPEPSSVLTLMSGLAILLVSLRRR